jgi:cyclic beta-1,2-glucan synthetase
VRKWTKHAGKLKKALEATAWDGEWYRRGSFDDGTPLGSRQSDECQIDSIAQSWSVLSGEGDPLRAKTAMDSAWSRLVDTDARIIKLFDPPFENTAKNPGYIKSYPPGVRENGGQYTHAAVWFVIALAEMGRAEEAWQAFSLINPVNHALDEASAERYRVEPYVVAADIYAADKAGRGGWTWYTGSAGWLYRAASEAILGIRRQGDRLFVTPCLPPHWPGFEAALRLGEALYRIKVTRGAAAETSFDGKLVEAGVPIEKQGEHLIEVTLDPKGATQRPEESQKMPSNVISISRSVR